MTVCQEILPTIRLGRDGPTVGIQGLGCMGMATGYYGPTDEKESLATLERALERGVTLFDTADAYGYGRNEEFIGSFIRANRSRVTVATKFGIVRTSDTNVTKVHIENRPEHIRRALDASLSRLGVDVIDLYYMHRRNPDVPLADSIGAMADLVAAGKIRFLGLSEVSAEELREASQALVRYNHPEKAEASMGERPPWPPASLDASPAAPFLPRQSTPPVEHFDPKP